MLGFQKLHFLETIIQNDAIDGTSQLQKMSLLSIILISQPIIMGYMLCITVFLKCLHTWDTMTTTHAPAPWTLHSNCSSALFSKHYTKFSVFGKTLIKKISCFLQGTLSFKILKLQFLLIALTCLNKLESTWFSSSLSQQSTRHLMQMC